MRPFATSLPFLRTQTVSRKLTPVVATPPVVISPPTDDPNLFSWHSSDSNLANDGINVASGSNAWVDRSGHAHNFGADPGFTPAYTASGPNGKPAIVWTDGSDKYFAYIATKPQPFTLFALVKTVTWNGNRYFWDGSASGASAALIQNSSTPLAQAYAGLFGPLITMPLGRWIIVTIIYDGASSIVQIDNNIEIAASLGTNVAGGVWLGNYSGATGPNSPGFQLAALIVTNNHADATARTLHKTWLADYGGVTLSPVAGSPPATGLIGWWKADAIAAANGASLAQWDDSSGSANHLTQVVGGSQPTYATNQVNGLPAVRFTTQYFNVPSMLGGLTQAEVFVVVRIDLDPPVDGFQTGLWNWGGTGERSHFPYVDGVVYDDFMTGSRFTTGNPNLSLAAWRCYNTSAANGGSWTSRLDGTQLFTTALGIGTFTNAGTSYVGLSLAGGGSNYYLAGWIAEILFYNATLSSGDRSTVNAYLSAKYALTIA